MREKKVAEERMRQIEEQNARVNAAKFKQKEFYMKYLRRNQEEPQPDLSTSMADFKKARFGNSKIGAGLARLPEFRQASFANHMN